MSQALVKRRMIAVDCTSLKTVKDFDFFLLPCISFVLRARGIVCVVYLKFGLASYKDLVSVATPDIS